MRFLRKFLGFAKSSKVCKTVLCVAALHASTMTATAQGLDCGDVYLNSVRNIKLETQDRSSKSFLFNLYCEKNGSFGELAKSGSVSFPIEGIPLEIAGDGSWTEQELKQFCEVGASSSYYEMREISFGSSVVVEALASYNQCLFLQKARLKVTHQEVAPAAFVVFGDFIGSTVDAKIDAVSYDPKELVCTSTNFSEDGTEEIIDGSRRYDPKKSNFSIKCVRTSHNDGSREYFKRTWFQLVTSLGPYSVVLPGDALLGPELASQAQAAYDAALAARNLIASQRDAAKANAASQLNAKNKFASRLDGSRVLLFYRGNQPQRAGIYNYGCGDFNGSVAAKECRALGGTIRQLELVTTFEGRPCGHSYWSGLCIPQ